MRDTRPIKYQNIDFMIAVNPSVSQQRLLRPFQDTGVYSTLQSGGIPPNLLHAVAAPKQHLGARLRRTFLLFSNIDCFD
jgi:hypothetical protein